MRAHASKNTESAAGDASRAHHSAAVELDLLGRAVGRLLASGVVQDLRLAVGAGRPADRVAALQDVEVLARGLALLVAVFRRVCDRARDRRDRRGGNPGLDASATTGAGSGVSSCEVRLPRTLIFCALTLGGGGESVKCLVPFASVQE